MKRSSGIFPLLQLKILLLLPNKQNTKPSLLRKPTHLITSPSSFSTHKFLHFLSLHSSLSLCTWSEPSSTCTAAGPGFTAMAAMRSALDDGQCSRTGSEVSGGKGFMLFGVRVMTEGSFRKSVSMNNLAQYDQLPQDSNNDVAAGYASDDVVHPSARSRERKRGVPWSEEEHRLFLLGLQKVGKGDWRGISRNYVKTRTPTQVASHAQKYFLRRNNHNRRRRRSSLFDITTDAVVGSAIDDQMGQEDVTNKQPKVSKNLTPVVAPITSETPMENLKLGQVNQLTNSPKPIRPIPILPVPPSSKMANLNLNKTNTIIEPPSLSLNLSISSSQPQEPPPPSGQQQPPPPARHASAFQGMPVGFNGSGGDSMISVA